MTQSLLSAGLGVAESYKVANEILRQLESRGIEQITKQELRDLAFGILHGGFGEQCANRYRERRSAAPQILVMKNDMGFPFSKGILSQSLQASGMDPSASHKLAREIERNLLQSERTSITRTELRRITTEAIETKYDEAFARRYSLWLDLKTPTKPIFILIGGGTGTGKSTIAAQLGHRLGLTHVLSTDIVRHMMRSMFSIQLMPSVHRSSYDAWKGFDAPLPEDKDPVVAAFREQLLRVSVGVQAMLDRALEENFSMIISGVHVVPGFIRNKYFHAAHTAQLVVTTEDEVAHRNRLHLRSKQARDRHAQKYVGNFESIRSIQDYVIGCARRHSLPIFDNVHIDNTVLSIIHFLTDFIKTAKASEMHRNPA